MHPVFCSFTQNPVFNKSAPSLGILTSKDNGRWLLADCFERSGPNGVRNKCSTAGTGAPPMLGEVDLLEPANPLDIENGGARWTPAAFGQILSSTIPQRDKLKDILVMFQWDPMLERMAPRPTDLKDGVDTVIFSLQHWSIGNNSGAFPIQRQADIVVAMMASYANHTTFPSLRKLIWLAFPCVNGGRRERGWHRSNMVIAGLRQLFVSFIVLIIDCKKLNWHHI